MSEFEADTGPNTRRLKASSRHAILFVTLLLAAFLRFWQLDSLPPGLQHDEAYNGLDALSLLKGETFPIFYEGWELYSNEAHANRPIFETRFPAFFEGNYGREPLAMYLMALSIWVFGATTFAIRFVPAIAGVLAVWATYLAAKELKGFSSESQERTTNEASDIISSLVPLLAALFMAVLYPAITISRFGGRVMLFVPLEALTVYCFWRGIQLSQRRSTAPAQTEEASALPLGLFTPGWFLLAGALMSLGFYTYAAARFLPLLFVSFVLIWFWKDRQAVRLQWANLTVMAVAAIVVAVPLVLFFIRHPYFLIFRARVVGNRGLGTFPGKPWLTWLYNIGRVFRGMFWRGDENLLHNLPGRAFLDPIQGLFAVAGVASIVLGGLKKREVFLLLWLLVMVLPGIVSGDAPHFGRLIGATVPLSILIAAGAVWLVELVHSRLPEDNPRMTQLVAVLLMLLVMASAALATTDYFWRYARDPQLVTAFDLADLELGQYAADLPGDATIYLTPNQELMATIYFALEGDRDRLRSFHSPDASLIPAGHSGQEAHYLIRPRADTITGQLASRFPDGRIIESGSSFQTFLLPNNTVRMSAQNPVDVSWGGAIGLGDWVAVQVDNALDITLVWEARVEMARNYTAFVHLLDEDGNLLAQLDRQPDGYPTNDWRNGEIVQDRYHIVLPDGIKPGSYIVQSGFYFLPTAERLGEPVVLGKVEIQ